MIDQALTRDQKRYKEARALGLCGNCRKNQAVPEQSQCASCKEQTRFDKFFRRYGLTANDLEDLYAKQQGKCAICMQAPEGDGPNGILHVDHDHITKRVRGLLCFECNHGLGNFKESKTLLERAVLYLEAQ